MKRYLNPNPTRLVAPLFAIFLTLIFALDIPVQAQRSRLVTVPQRDLQGTPILPAGTQTLPETTVLILEMETRLESNRSRVSDRFEASVATPIIDANGRTLVPQGTRVEGRVTSVQPAKWGSRSGTIGISFDYMLLDGKRLPIRGFLTPADDRTRKQMDMEGNLKGGNTAKRTFLFVGGGAGTGATIAAFSSAGLLAATGVGAVAGLTTSLLWKGKDAVVIEGQRFGLQLTTPLRVGSPYTTQRQILPVRGRYGTTGSILGGTGVSPTFQQGASEYDPNAIRTTVRAVPVYDVRAERTGDGYLRVLISSETPTAGWRVYTHHQLTNNNTTLEVRLRGFPPSSYGYPQVSHPSAPTIIVQDRNGVVTRVIVHGSNGSRTVAISGIGIGYTEQPGSTPGTQPTPYRPRTSGDYASDGSSITIGPPLTTGPTTQPRPVQPSSGGLSGETSTNLVALADRAANDLEVFRENLTSMLGLWRNRDGSYESSNTRKVTANERQMVDGVGYLIDSARALTNTQLTAQQRRTYAQRLRDDFQVSNQLWMRINVSPDLNNRWKGCQQSVTNLINVAYR